MDVVSKIGRHGEILFSVEILARRGGDGGPLSMGLSKSLIGKFHAAEQIFRKFLIDGCPIAPRCLLYQDHQRTD